MRQGILVYYALIDKPFELRQNVHMEIAMKLIGALGLLMIIGGILVTKRTTRNYIYIVGGILLEAYSIYIGDIIFVVLQAVFTVVAIYDLLRERREINSKNKKRVPTNGTL